MDENVEIGGMDNKIAVSDVSDNDIISTSDFTADRNTEQLSLLPDLGIQDDSKDFMQIVPSEDGNIDVIINKPYGMIHFRVIKGNELDANDFRLLHKLYLFAKKTHYDREIYHMKRSDMDYTRFEHLLKSFHRLRDTPIEWNRMMYDKKNNKEWRGITGFGFLGEFTCSPDNNDIIFVIPPTLRKLLAMPIPYAPINTEITGQLSRFAFYLYEHFMVVLSTNRNNGCLHATPVKTVHSLEELRIITHAEDKYPRLYNFISQCIRKPIKEINLHSNIRVEWDGTFKKNEWEFTIIPKLRDYNNRNNKNATKPTAEKLDSALMKKLVKIYGNETTAKRGIKIAENNEKHKIADSTELRNYVLANIEYVEKQNKVGSFSAYLTKALKNDYADYFYKKEEIARQKEKENWNTESEKILKDLQQSEKREPKGGYIGEKLQPDKDRKQKPEEPPPETISERLKKINVIETPERLKNKLDIIRYGENGNNTKYLKERSSICSLAKQLFADDKNNYYLIIPSEKNYHGLLNEEIKRILLNEFGENTQIMTFEEMVKHFFSD
jgi:hypothetical protein